LRPSANPQAHTPSNRAANLVANPAANPVAFPVADRPARPAAFGGGGPGGAPRPAEVAGDDAHTVLMARLGVAPRAAAARSPVTFGETLSIGPRTRVRRAKMAGPGGFSRDVVVKQLSPELRGKPSAEAALNQEGALLARLQSPHVVRLLDRVQLDGSAALVFEELPGVDLGELLRGGPLPLRAGLELLAQVARGLAAVHGARDLSGDRIGLCHGDLRADSVRVAPNGRASLVGFGAARATFLRSSVDFGLMFDIDTAPVVPSEDGPSTQAGDLWALGQLIALCLLPGGLWMAEQGPLMQVSRADELQRVDPAVAVLARRLQSSPVERRPAAIDVARSLSGMAAQAVGPRLCDLPLRARGERPPSQPAPPPLRSAQRPAPVPPQRLAEALGAAQPLSPDDVPTAHFALAGLQWDFGAPLSPAPTAAPTAVPSPASTASVPSAAASMPAALRPGGPLLAPRAPRPLRSALVKVALGGLVLALGVALAGLVGAAGPELGAAPTAPPRAEARR
jgi:serine/threonine protein kinase